MNITTMMLGELATNCYIVATEKGNGIAIDIGNDPETLLKVLSEQQLTLKKILLTHGHYDHTGGVEAVRKATGAAVFIHAADAAMLQDETSSLFSWLSMQDTFDKIGEYQILRDGDTIVQDELTFQVLHTPGHTKGSVCYVCGDVIFSGDTLFRLSRGRTDFPGGSVQELAESLRKLKHLPGTYRVLPGHNEETTLEFERKNNPSMKGLE